MSPTVNRKKSVILIIILIMILIAAAGIATLLFQKYVASRQSIDEITPELTDEFSRARWFIVDWYDELKTTSDLQVYMNELRFEDGTYTLTVAKDRIRAVYPRGERFFKLELIKKIEFFEVDGYLRCRLYYGESGQYSFRVN